MELDEADSGTEPRSLAIPATVYCLGEDRTACSDRQTVLASHGFDVRTGPPTLDGEGALDDPDCLVYGPSAMQAAADALATVRERYPGVAVVVVVDDPPAHLVKAIAERPWAAMVEAGDTARIADCVDRLVSCHRATTVATRTLAAIENSGDGVAIVAPDGAFEYVNEPYARRFGYDATALVGQPWETCFPADEAGRLRSDVLTTVSEDWQWVGGCVGKQKDGGTFKARARVTGLEDGGLVFTLPETDSQITGYP